jgi:flagella basal body P-ring formation protein FlgA
MAVAMLISLTWRALGFAVLFAMSVVAHPGGAVTGSVANAGTVANAGAAANAVARQGGDPLVRDAIVAAVKARMGEAAAVTVGEMRVRGLDTVDGMAVMRMVAVPDAGAKVGGFVRFLLYEDAKHERRAGSVDAEVFVTAPHVRARRALAHRTTLEASDFERVTADVGRMPLEALPDEALLTGARVTRPVAEGQAIVATMVASTQLVKSGDEVRTIVRIGALEARGSAIAAQSGALGDEIRVVNAESKRALKARVSGEGEVEVIHER